MLSDMDENAHRFAFSVLKGKFFGRERERYSFWILYVHQLHISMVKIKRERERERETKQHKKASVT